MNNNVVVTISETISKSEYDVLLNVREHLTLARQKIANLEGTVRKLEREVIDAKDNAKNKVLIKNTENTILFDPSGDHFSIDIVDANTLAHEYDICDRVSQRNVNFDIVNRIMQNYVKKNATTKTTVDRSFVGFDDIRSIVERKFEDELKKEYEDKLSKALSDNTRLTETTKEQYALHENLIKDISELSLQIDQYKQSASEYNNKSWIYRLFNKITF